MDIPDSTEECAVKTTRVRGLALLSLGIVGLLVVALVGPAWAADAGGAQAVTGARNVQPVQAQTQATPGATRDSVLDMLRDHMGLTGDDAEAWADDMLGHMQAVHGDQTGEMVQACSEYAGENGGAGANQNGTTWRGMMGGASGSAMMGGSL